MSVVTLAGSRFAFRLDLFVHDNVLDKRVAAVGKRANRKLLARGPPELMEYQAKDPSRARPKRA